MYVFQNDGAGTYSVQINGLQGQIGNLHPAVNLPNNYKNTGDEIGSMQGATPNGVSETFSVASVAVTEVNFGMQQQPSVVSRTLASQPNPGGTTNVTIPSLSFDGNDLNGGKVVKLTINSFPTNTTTTTIDDIVYFDPSNPPATTTGMTAFPASGIDVPVDASVTHQFQF